MRIVTAAPILLLCGLLPGQASWSMLYAANAPAPRYSGAMAFHEGSGQMVLFGGQGSSSALGDCWLLQGQTWVPVAGPLPPARARAAAVYDSVRDRIVLFGGTTGGSSASKQDTWEFDGTTWSQVSLALSPPARHSHSMAFDRQRGVTVLYGGYFWDSLQDLWEYDGTSWQQVAATNAPGPRHDTSLAFDPANGDVLLYGGAFEPASGPTQIRTDTWSWDGSAWHHYQPATPPMLHRHGVAVADLARERVVQTSGIQGGPFAWEWDGTNWHLLLMASPGERESPMIGYDTDARRVVMFGGLWMALPQNDSWQYTTPLPAMVDPYGSGCGGGAGTPELRAADGELPWIGDVMRNVVTNVPSGSLGALFVSSFTQLPPFDLTGLGMPGCELLVQLDVVEFAVAAGGQAEWTTPIPNTIAVAGVPFYQQAFPMDGAANALGFSASNGVVATPGVR